MGHGRHSVRRRRTETARRALKLRSLAILDRVAPSHQQVRVLLRDAEDLQRERFATELADELALVEDASSLLAKVVGMAVSRGGDVEIDVDDDTGVPSEADT